MAELQVQLTDLVETLKARLDAAQNDGVMWQSKAMELNRLALAQKAEIEKLNAELATFKPAEVTADPAAPGAPFDEPIAEPISKPPAKPKLKSVKAIVPPTPPKS